MAAEDVSECIWRAACAAIDVSNASVDGVLVTVAQNDHHAQVSMLARTVQVNNTHLDLEMQARTGSQP